MELKAMRVRANFGWMDFNRRCVIPASRPAITRGILIPVLAAIAVSSLGMTDAPAQDTASLRLCASRDIEAVTLIEDHGEANDIAPEQLAKVALTQMEARFACSGGHTEEGIALYNDIFRALGPMLSRRQ
jgi:hypothetical protein